jgi:hypothetical protein
MSMRIVVASVLTLVAAACTTTSQTPTPTPRQPVSLRIATLNIEYGGEVVDFDATVRAALALDADVIGVEEAWGNIPRLAVAMGYRYHDRAHHVISRLPLIRPAGDPSYLLADTGDGVIAIANMHLTSSPYGPAMAMRGRSAAEIVETEERVRVPEIEAVAISLANLADDGIPAFIVGDLNSPSHLDWTTETTGERPQIIEPIAWPVTTLLEGSGFVDSYRAVHPDPTSDPGLTWPADRPRTDDGWNPPRTAPHDRIDYVWYTGAVTPETVQILGEEGAADLSSSPWPTDHRGVVASVSVTPGAAPIAVAVDDPLVVLGQTVSVRTYADVPVSVQLRDADGTVVTSGDDGTIETSGLALGAYSVVMADGDTDLASTPMWVVGFDLPPDVRVADDTIARGDPLEVSWSGAPGHRWDWIGVYRRGADPEVAWYLTWAYTGATVEGSVTLDGDAEGRWPLPPGEYTVHLLVDDSYQTLASADFTITGS